MSRSSCTLPLGARSRQGRVLASTGQEVQRAKAWVSTALLPGAAWQHEQDRLRAAVRKREGGEPAGRYVVQTG